LDDSGAEKDIMHIKTGLFTPQLEAIVASLPEWKEHLSWSIALMTDAIRPRT
jgi:hypothetical protein